MRLYFEKVKRSAGQSWLQVVALIAIVLSTGCLGTPKSTTTPAWQLANQLTLGMKKKQVNKVMRWQQHRNRSYSTPLGVYEDWIYSPGHPLKQVHLRFHKGRLITIGRNQKTPTGKRKPGAR